MAKGYYLDMVLPTGKVERAGILAVQDDDRGTVVQFKYAEGYLGLDNSFPIDPVNLPLRPDTFTFRTAGGTLPGFVDDMLPDSWGRRILSVKLGKKHLSIYDMLDNISPAYAGALCVTPSNRKSKPLLSGGVDIERVAKVIHKEVNLADANAFDEAILMTLYRGSSIGGARPKILARDKGEACILKFKRRDDPLNMVAAEHASMTLSGHAGMHVAKTEVIQLSSEFDALKVSRFDLSGDHGRRHMVSLNSMLKGRHGVDPTGGSYIDIANVVAKVSANPDEDLKLLYRHMVCNYVMNNTDDHLRNFSMYRADDGWRLTPAYDITPSEVAGAYHQLSGGLMPLSPKSMLLSAGSFRLTESEAKIIMQEVGSEMADWQDHFLSSGCDMKDIDTLAAALNSRRLVDTAPSLTPSPGTGQ